MNARNSCLANKTEIGHSCLFQKITVERGRKTPEMIVPYDRKTHYCSREDLLWNKWWRNNSDDLKTFRLKEHIVPSGTLTYSSAGQGLLPHSLLRSLGPASHNLLTCSHPSDEKDCVTTPKWVFVVVCHALRPAPKNHQCRSFFRTIFSQIHTKTEKKLFTEIIETGYLGRTKCRKCIHLIKL